MRWFYTGDIGQFHPDGCLEIIDRKKDIVKLQHGEYISLGKVEAVLGESPYVENIMVHANPFHSYAVAIIVASQQVLESWAIKKGIHYNIFEDLCGTEEATKEVLLSLQKVAKDFVVRCFIIDVTLLMIVQMHLWIALDSENGLVTAALKLKREHLRKLFAEELKKLYAYKEISYL
ncbi:hypothetical protein L7F22_022733 [Adiantum nelumboides]|nr:hypothetical protein [Adiantum nelumboides]